PSPLPSLSPALLPAATAAPPHHLPSLPSDHLSAARVRERQRTARWCQGQAVTATVDAGSAAGSGAHPGGPVSAGGEGVARRGAPSRAQRDGSFMRIIPGRRRGISTMREKFQGVIWARVLCLLPSRSVGDKAMSL
ncbi:unnamed protein product, partial [Urochloa humidicola]